MIADLSGIVEQDFYKAANTPDPTWAETCYMRWWLDHRYDTREDATFFSADEVGYGNFLAEFQRVSSEMARWKSNGSVVDLGIAELPRKINELHNRISRLVACYLIYRNGSKKQLCGAARSFGIELSDPVQENPLGYWIIYAVVLVASVISKFHVGRWLRPARRQRADLRARSKPHSGVDHVQPLQRHWELSDPSAARGGTIHANRF